MTRTLTLIAVAALAAGCASKEPRPLSPEQKSARNDLIFPADCRYLTPSERMREPRCADYQDPAARRSPRGPGVQLPEAPLGELPATPLPPLGR
jgi:hypothetical protein